MQFNKSFLLFQLAIRRPVIMGCKIVEVASKRVVRAALLPKVLEVPLPHVTAIATSTNEESAILRARLQDTSDELGAPFIGVQDPA